MLTQISTCHGVISPLKMLRSQSQFFLTSALLLVTAASSDPMLFLALLRLCEEFTQSFNTSPQSYATYGFFKSSQTMFPQMCLYWTLLDLCLTSVSDHSIIFLNPIVLKLQAHSIILIMGFFAFKWRKESEDFNSN